jgi:REP-associated tyrosine transposase
MKMAQTLFSSYLHIVFSTKNRLAIIPAEIEDELYAYVGGLIRNFECVLLKAGGTANHIHLLVSLSKNCLVPDLIGAVKRNSSKWIKTKGGVLEKFAWQDGYSAFSVGHTQIAAVRAYIADQKQHHKQRLFEDEMRSFYRKYNIEFDEKYIWD